MALSRIRRASLEDMAAFIDQKEADVLEVLANEIPERQQFDTLNSAIEELCSIRESIATDGICQSTAMSLESINPDAIPRGYTVNSFTQHHSRVGLTATMEAVDGLTIGLVVAAVAAAVAIMVKLTQWVIKRWNKDKAEKYVGASNALEEAEQNGAKPDLSDENVEFINKRWNKAIQKALEPNPRSVFHCFMSGYNRQNIRKALDGIGDKIALLEKSQGGWGSLFGRGKDNAEMAKEAIAKAIDNTAINELGRSMNWLGTGSSKDFDVTVKETYKELHDDVAVKEGAPNDDWSERVTVANNLLNNTHIDYPGIVSDFEHLNKKLIDFQKKLDGAKNSNGDADGEINKALREAIVTLKNQVEAITSLSSMFNQYRFMFNELTLARSKIVKG